MSVGFAGAIVEFDLASNAYTQNSFGERKLLSWTVCGVLGEHGVHPVQTAEVGTILTALRVMAPRLCAPTPCPHVVDTLSSILR